MQTKYHNKHETKEDRYNVQMRSQTKASSTSLPAVHFRDIGVDPSLKPQTQTKRNPALKEAIKLRQQIKEIFLF